MDELTQTPKPHRSHVETGSFSDAIGWIAEGKRVTRLEWDDQEEYGHLKDHWLMIHTKEKDHTWLVSESDLMADDWVIIPSLN